jgi:imidazolonepropionase-like amidohydrolase
VIDVLTGERHEPRAIETADGTVVQVAATAPPGQDAVDVAGRWLLPGLISCHTHLSVVFPFSATDEAENPALTAYRSAARASEALRAGITTIRCVHEQNRADLLLRTAVRRGWFAAPRILGAGRAVSTPGGHGQGSACAYATGEQEFYLAALAELAAGADHVKIFINGGLDPSTGPDEHYEHAEMTDGEIRGAVRAAAEHDTYVVAHSGEPTAIRQALAQGVRCFEHAYRLDDETAALLARPGIFVTPTLCVTRSESWMRDRGFEEHSIRHASQAADVHLASVQRAIRAGVTLINGTDIPPGDPVDGVPAAVHELLLMAAAGLSPLLSLQSVSVNGAALLGIADHVGQIRPGYAADFVAVAADPLDDLAALREISLVVQGGRVIREDTA